MNDEQMRERLYRQGLLRPSEFPTEDESDVIATTPADKATPTEEHLRLALAIVKQVDMRFENSERLRLGKWLLPEERQNTIAQIIAVALAAREAEVRESCAREVDDWADLLHANQQPAWLIDSVRKMAAAIRASGPTKEER